MKFSPSQGQDDLAGSQAHDADGLSEKKTQLNQANNPIVTGSRLFPVEDEILLFSRSRRSCSHQRKKSARHLRL